MASRTLSRRLAEAMADNLAIGWDALLLETRTEAERAGIQRLRALDQVRPRERTTLARGPLSFSGAVIGGVLLLASVQVLSAMAFALGFAVRGTPVGWPIPQLGIALAFTTAAALLLKARRDRRATPLIAAFIAAASAFCRPFVGSGSDIALLGPLYLGVVADALIPACFWVFALQFPRVTRFTTFDAVALFVSRIAIACGCFLLVTNVVVEYGIVTTPRLLLFRRGTALYWLLFISFMLPALLAVFWRATSAPPAERLRVRRFAFALFGCLLPYAVWQVFLAAVPPVRAWAVATPTPPLRLPIDVAVLTGFLMTPILTAAAVTIDRTFDTTALLRKATQYALARVTLLALVTAPFLLLAGTVYVNRDRTITELLSGPAARILIGLAALALVALLSRSWLTAVLDRTFSKRRLDHRVALASALERIRSARSQREVAAVLAAELSRVLQAERLVVFSRDHSGRLDVDFGQAEPIPLGGGLAALLDDGKGPIDLSSDSDSYSLLPSNERAWLDKTQLSLLLPIRKRTGAVQSVIAVQRGSAPLPPTADDEWLLRSLATASAAVWESFDHQKRNGTTVHPDDGEDSAIECSHCGAVEAHAPVACGCTSEWRLAALPAILHGKFRIVRRLGHGAMGVVYLARDLDLGRDVALKTLPNVSGAAIERLRSEARSMASVTHENVAVIYGIEVWRDTPALVVEYMKGGTLADRLRQGPLPLQEALDLAIQLARGIASLHTAGLLHRDIKPSNIGLTGKGVAKLLDFGVAEFTGGVGQLAGTPLYWPPEAFQGTSPTASFDLWALSLSLYEALSGRHPIAARSLNEIQGFWRSTQQNWLTPAPDSPALCAYLALTLSLDPSSRPSTASILADALQSFRVAQAQP